MESISVQDYLQAIYRLQEEQVRVSTSALADRLAGRAGIVEHGLFIGLTTDLIVAGAHGVRHVTRG